MVAFLDRIIGLIKRVSVDTKTESIYTKDLLKEKPYEVGEYTYGLPNVLSWGEQTNLYIGKFCSIADHVTIFLGGNHRTDWISTYPFNVLSNSFPNAKNIIGHPASKGDVVIGNDVWIASGAVILSGVKIGNGAIIAANAVVTKDVPSYSIVAGNPASIVKMRYEKSVIEQLEKIAWWNWSVEKINKNVSLLCSGNVFDFIKNNYV